VISFVGPAREKRVEKGRKHRDPGAIREKGRRWRFMAIVFLCGGGLLHPLSSTGQEIKWEGWPVPDVKGLVPYSVSIKKTDGVEKMIEKFQTRTGGHVARILGNGKIFAYAVDRDQEPPIDYLILDPEGSGKFTMKFGSEESYFIPEWVSR
jgi:hypothetical protein